jgi:predicted extracellular nuclease
MSLLVAGTVEATLATTTEEMFVAGDLPQSLTESYTDTQNRMTALRWAILEENTDSALVCNATDDIISYDKNLKLRQPKNSILTPLSVVAPASATKTKRQKSPSKQTSATHLANVSPVASTSSRLPSTSFTTPARIASTSASAYPTPALESSTSISDEFAEWLK